MPDFGALCWFTIASLLRCCCVSNVTFTLSTMHRPPRWRRKTDSGRHVIRSNTFHSQDELYRKVRRPWLIHTLFLHLTWDACWKLEFRESPSQFALLYRSHDLRGGHVIKLGPGNDEAARSALAAWPGTLLYSLPNSMHSFHNYLSKLVRCLADRRRCQRRQRSRLDRSRCWKSPLQSRQSICIVR